jgi:hypothetical protein
VFSGNGDGLVGGCHIDEGRQWRRPCRMTNLSP